MFKRTLVATASLALFVGCTQQQNQNASNAPGHDTAGRTDFEKVKDPPITADTHYAAAQLAISRKNYDQAIKQYQIALKMNPNHLGSIYGLACLQTKLKQYPDAIASWQRYVKATGQSAVAYSDLAFCEEIAGNPAAAEADYRRGIQRDPKNEACRVNYGLMLARHERIGEATIQFQTVLTSAEVHYNLASVYEGQGRKEQAKSEYEKAVELDPGLEEAKAKLAALN